MDVDFLSGEDAVQKFLTSKLKLAEARKQELAEQLERRQSILKQTLRTSSSESSKGTVIVESTWKKLVNNTYVIGINISSKR